jgi:hypothetical protein
MHMSDGDPISPALIALQSVRICLIWARVDAQAAAANLTGARAARAVELVERLADDLCWVERLSFIVTADEQYERHQKDLD